MCWEGFGRIGTGLTIEVMPVYELAGHEVLKSKNLT